MLSPHPLIRVLSTDLNMAAKFVVAVALFAVCHSSPVLINDAIRDGRSYSIGQAYNSGSGVSTAQANVHGDVAQAFGSSTGGAQLARDGYYYPGQSIAQAQTYNNPANPNYGSANAVAQAQNGPYYPVPAPATLITYEQNFAAPAEVVYEVPSALAAQSSAVSNGASDSSVASATSNGAGVAESTANTQRGVGSYGSTSSNAKTSSYGYGSANSNANSGYGSTSTSAKSNGQGSASSAAQANGVAYPVVAPVAVVPAAQVYPTVIEAKTPVFQTAYVPFPVQGVASSNANVIGSGSAASSAKVSRGRTISWRFGTLYDAPAAAHAQANTYSGFGAAKSAANTHGHGSANAHANTYGAGASNANADAHSAGYGSAKSAANVHGAYYGGSRTSADAQSHGFGNAASSANSQGLSTAFRVTNSQANSSGYGSAHANAQSL
ncbi:unnamed protein product [Chrysodeixis includens]|uniref:Fibroin heavy chain n=1 Tax=Chrysodeixis includens TaxID=689277 RepID=A0A9N8PWM0_CHRIL|nr:unnamed protein product [Chrysodeixis includens]